MSKFRILVVALLFVAGVATGLAQRECLSVGSRLSVEDIQTFLRSGSMDLIAWGAYFAGESSDDGVITTMLQLMDRGVTSFTPAEPYRGPYSSCSANVTTEAAMLEILDALIKRRVAVPSEAISAAAASHPAQAFILATRLPPERSRALFEGWYYSARSDYDANLRQDERILIGLARLSAMMLAKSPPPGFAAHLLASSEERMIVSVTSDKSGFPDPPIGVGLSGACKDNPNYAVPEHFPPIVQYGLEENKPEKDPDFEPDHLLVTSGGDRITYRAAPVGMALNVCYPVRALTPETRRHLIAEMLRVREDQIPWKARVDVAIRWESRKDFEATMRVTVGTAEEKLRMTTEAMYKMGLLTADEAHVTRPRLTVSAYDDRWPSNNGQEAIAHPLPELKFQDTRTSFELPPWTSSSGRD